MKIIKKIVKNRIDRIYCHINPVEYARSIGVTIGGGLAFMEPRLKCFQQNHG